MTPDRFHLITRRYSQLRLAVVGDLCLDRYLEIDPARAETSIETGLPVHNVVRVRAQPGAAGTILNNLSAVGVGVIYPVSFHGDDGEGYELRRALESMFSLRLDHFIQAADRRTFTYCKPLVLEASQPPRELNRLDSKNWSPTPAALQQRLADAIRALADHVDGLIVMDQVEVPEAGVITRLVLEAIADVAKAHPGKVIVADSRRSLKGFPSVCFKMNATELAALVGSGATLTLEQVRLQAVQLARTQGRFVFVTLAENGILGASPDGSVEHLPALPLRGPIDIVGAGDAVTANLAAALASGATLREAIGLANAAASIVIHQLGTTGTADLMQIGTLLNSGG